MFDKICNTRVAPSPTGFSHIGLVRTTYLNYLAARSTGGKFILRIDDTDKERSKDEYLNDMLNVFKWLGIEYDHAFKQSSRFDVYTKIANQLVAMGRAKKEDDAVKLICEHTILSWKDEIAGDIKITPDNFKNIDGLVLLRADGSPTYHFASVVDDIQHDINLVIRGTDHIDNTAKHVYIYNAIERELPRFAHVGLIHHNGKKISKRDGISSMKLYMNEYCPEAVLNFVLKLGWSHSDSDIDKKYPLIDKETAIKLFPGGHLRSTKSTLDLEKLKWLNRKHLQKLKIS